MHKILHTKNKRNIAYQYNKGQSSLGLIFFSGFNSDMHGNKAQFIFNWCIKNNIECTIFDYSGHGSSSEDFIDCDISMWINDGLDIIDEITLKPQIYIGSSMGAWIAIKIALMRPQIVKGLITIAAAPDFTNNFCEENLNKNQIHELNNKGYVNIKSNYDEKGYIITKNLIESGNKNLILNNSLSSLNYPIKLIHGEKDKDVDWKKSLEIFNKIKSPNAELILIKDGDHRLSSEKNLITIIDSVKSLIISLSH